MEMSLKTASGINVVETFTLTINTPVSVPTLIRKGGYKLVDPVALLLRVWSDFKGDTTLEGAVIRMPNDSTVDEIVNCIQENGFRPATLVELLAWRITQKFNNWRTIIALGSIVRRPGRGSARCAHSIQVTKKKRFGLFNTTECCLVGTHCDGQLISNCEYLVIRT